MMRKLITVFLAALMLLSVFTACSKPEPSSSPSTPEEIPKAVNKTGETAEPITINFLAPLYSDKTESYMQSVIDAYEAEHSNIKINLEIVGWDNVETRITTLVGAKTAPDLFCGMTVTGFVEDGLVYNVEDIISPELKADFYPTFWENNVTPGYNVCFQIPYLASVRALYYNKKLFEQAGIETAPKTWTEVEETCAKLKDFYKGEVYPWGLDTTITEGETTIAYYGWNNGGGYVDENDEYILNCPANVEGFEWMKSLYDKGYTNENPNIETRDDMQKLVVADKLAMLITANFFPALYPDTELGLGAIPYNDKNVSQSSTLAVQDALAIFNDTSKKDKDTPEKVAAIRDFLDFFYSPAYYVPFMVQEGMLPATKSGTELLAKENPEQAAYLNILEGARFYAINKLDYQECLEGCREAAQKVMTEMQTPQEALDDLQASLTNK